MPSVSSYTSAMNDEDISLYLPLHRAALRGDWESAERFFSQHNNENAFTAIITYNGGTALHVAVATRKAHHFLENVVQRIPTEALVIKNYLGKTALHVAAQVGNTEAAIILVENNRAALLIRNNAKHFPVHHAALYEQKDTLAYLISETKNILVGDDFANQCGVFLLIYVIESEFIGEY
ncbi:uncharacterized protein LOC132310007 [Cornus florida]|uniref:uncharacterized protein LOC132310007 n=1 Tax=Cornus florida TaxID=4283 RepID=UPI002898765E|nr:uncharacterized protein LOC132310007 [Cornus florida]